MEERRMQIGEVAERTGLSVRTIRFYEESGLVAPSARSQGGFRLYTDRDVDRLQVIRRLKPLNFSIEDIRDVLGLLDRLAEDDHSRGNGEGRAELVQRLVMYRQLADQRVTGLHDSWSAAATFASHLRQQIERLQRLPEARP
jgi:DNA-binding transcriptional MerR regulator